MCHMNSKNIYHFLFSSVVPDKSTDKISVVTDWFAASSRENRQLSAHVMEMIC